MNFKKIILNVFIFIFFVSITFYFVFKDNNINEIFEIAKYANKLYIFIAILCMSFFILAEGTNIGRILKLLNCKPGFWNLIKYAFVGFFFSSVTPGSSGGDPMQIYYMKKDGLTIGQSTLAILTEFSSFQFVTILFSLIGFFTNYKFIEESIGNIKYLLFLGIIINTLLLTLLILTVFSKKLIINIVNFICKILGLFRYKKVEQFREKCLIQIKEYKDGANLLMKNKKVLIKIILTTLIQIILFHSIPYLIYLSFGLTGMNYFKFLAIQAVLYISVSYIPIPGAVGVSEGRFYDYI